MNLYNPINSERITGGVLLALVVGGGILHAFMLLQKIPKKATIETENAWPALNHR